MDWSKAKSILIVAFIIVNIILGIVVFSSDQKIDDTVSKKFLEEVTELLSNKNISINTKIPTEIPKLKTLTVEYEIIDENDINNNYFEGNGKVESPGKNVIEVSNNDEKITITNKKVLLYENENKVEKFKELNEEIATDIALTFLKEKKYDISDMVISFTKIENNEYHLNYTKIFNKRYVEKTKTDIIVDSRGVKSLERIWLYVLEEGETPIYISTAPKAILGLLNMEEVYGKTIKDISLIYSFDFIEQNHIKDLKNAKKGGTVPAWRVLFEDGYKVIIESQ